MSFVLVEKEDRILKITLNRPERHNAFNSEMIAQATAAFRQAGKDSDVRLVLLSGEGKSFCSGADIEWMRSTVNYSLDQNLEDSRKLFEMFETAATCPVPVLTRVHGNVMGGGLGLMAASDIVVADAETKFAFSETRLGIIPAVISPFVIRKAGPSHCLEVMATAEVFGSEKAKAMNLVHFAGESDEAMDYIQSKADYILANGPEAVRHIKALLWTLQSAEWAKVREACIRAIAERRISSEGQEGLKAFLEKRSPSWKSE